LENNNKQIVILLTVISLFCFIRSLFLDADINFLYGSGWAGDEPFYYYNSINKIRHHTWTLNPAEGEGFNERFISSFLYIYMNYLIAKIFGISLYSFRLLTYFLSLILCILFYFFLSKHFNKKEALLSLLLLNSTNTFLSISRIVRPEVLMLIFLCACLLLLQIKKNALIFISGIFFGTCLFFIKTNSFVFLFVFALYFFVFHLENHSNFKSVVKPLSYFILGILPTAILYAYFIHKNFLLFKSLTPVILFENNFSLYNFLKQGFFLWSSNMFSLDPFLYGFSIALLPIFALSKNKLLKISSLSILFIIGINLFFRLGYELIRIVFILPFCIIISQYTLFKMSKEEWISKLEELKENLNKNYLYKILADFILIFTILSWLLINYFSLAHFIHRTIYACSLSLIILLFYLYKVIKYKRENNYPITLLMYFHSFFIAFPFGNLLNWIISSTIPSKYYTSELLIYCSYTIIFLLSIIFAASIFKSFFDLSKIKKAFAIGLIISTLTGIAAQFIKREYTMIDYVKSASNIVEDGSVVYGYPSAILLLEKNIYALRNTHKESNKTYIAILSLKEFPYPYKMEKYKLLLKKELACFGINRKCLINILLYEMKENKKL